MFTIPIKLQRQLTTGIKAFQPVVANAQKRDINEADTVRIVNDMLGDIFGYDKYADITSEMCIRGGYCDLAIKLGDKVRVIIEAKAIGTELKDTHLRQAVDYAANQGVEWVILTNAAHWKFYKINFQQPITSEEMFSFTVEAVNPNRQTDLDMLYVLSKAGTLGKAAEDYYARKQSVNKFFMGALVLSAPVLEVIKREFRRITDIKVETEALAELVTHELVKREIIESEEFVTAKRRIQRYNSKKDRAKLQAATTKGAEVTGVSEGVMDAPAPVVAEPTEAPTEETPLVSAG
jgi:hypothetical protein